MGAVAPVAPFIVMTTVQVPVVPEVKCPAAAPPTVADAEQPESVNLVLPDINAAPLIVPVKVAFADPLKFESVVKPPTPLPFILTLIFPSVPAAERVTLLPAAPGATVR